MTNLISYTLSRGVATITLNRPDKYNALNTEMTQALIKAFKQAAAPAVRAVVFTGMGKGFSAGQDLTEFTALQQNGVDVGDHLRTGYNALIQQMRALPKPVIVAVNGVAAGAGASLTLGGDLRLAAEDASFVFGAFLGIGLVPDTGTTVLLTQMLGAARAMELALLNDNGNRLSAQRALELGLVNRVTPTDTVQHEAQELAFRLAQQPTTAIGLTKRAVYRAAGSTLADGLEYEAQLQGIAVRTHDHQEGVAAFLGKRAPEFTGS